MKTQGPDGKGTPEEPDSPEEIWLKFLTDSEAAIRRSAPKEPSARARSPEWRPRTGNPDRPEQRPGQPHDCETDAVGELWQPDEPRVGPAWRDLDGRARFRRVGRVVASTAAITLALGAWSWLSTGSGAPDDTPEDTLVQQLEEPPPGTSPAAVGSPSSSAATTG
ncbi:hypothetical protein F7R91_41275 [Streptomyces luteolifulvus]|uniref:Uncharacterized protein n=1 Tax=Streptomyces luteolifulvus TaxID=2615112 RepID=A0A6H9UN02_9ACTN|nr:hypothetical protein F7R91_41275 [Streptomyces luteolifulvus]